MRRAVGGARVFIFLAGAALACLCAEFAARLFLFGWTPDLWRTDRALDYSHNLITMAYPAQLDRTLGWVPRANFSGDDNVWKTRVTILADTTRSNGTGHFESSTKILAVGDSFVFGDQVNDDETWPAKLETLTKTTVVNGGVFNYGLDQIVLRARELLKTAEPRDLVVGIYLDDIYRSSHAVRAGLPKPYFTLEKGNIVLHEIPFLPVELFKKGPPKDFFKSVFGYSFLVDLLMKKISPTYWYIGANAVQVVQNDPEAVSCRLLADLGESLFKSGVHAFLLPQYSGVMSAEEVTGLENLRVCAGPRYTFIDLLTPLRDMKRSSPEIYSSFFQGHMTPAGNGFVAQLVARAIDAREIARPR